ELIAYKPNIPSTRRTERLRGEQHVYEANSTSTRRTARLRGEQRLYELTRLERRQVLRPLARPHEAHRHLELVAHREDHAALRRAVELRQHDAGHADQIGRASCRERVDISLEGTAVQKQGRTRIYTARMSR